MPVLPLRDFEKKELLQDWLIEIYPIDHHNDFWTKEIRDRSIITIDALFSNPSLMEKLGWVQKNNICDLPTRFSNPNRKSVP